MLPCLWLHRGNPAMGGMPNMVSTGSYTEPEVEDVGICEEKAAGAKSGRPHPEDPNHQSSSPGIGQPSPVIKFSSLPLSHRKKVLCSERD